MTEQVKKNYLVSHIVDRLTEYLILDRDIELVDALKIVYQSKTYQLLQDEVGDLYSQSPSYIYELLKEEIDFVR
ncbi:MAG: hypothetical protein IKB64_02705 [Paludibacteraceae bacterium]|jgi:hypothetical protein|nr:hypothetical protein [Paludibacteraceae bacterium]MBR2492366.1 hypothetical protein [Paludibacteraceae bacterium]MBR3871936.1 hypothetical protein [Paludibacteraceae bacterium]MBR6686633.1 hypothetical protein [Paludibacteraceae bacterium]